MLVSQVPKSFVEWESFDLVSGFCDILSVRVKGSDKCQLGSIRSRGVQLKRKVEEVVFPCYHFR